MSTNELTAKIRELRELQALIEEAEQEADAIRDTIKAHMGSSEELTAGDYKVRWVSVKSSRLDSSALKQAMPEVYSAFARPTETRRFSVA